MSFRWDFHMAQMFHLRAFNMNREVQVNIFVTCYSDCPDSERSDSKEYLYSSSNGGLPFTENLRETSPFVSFSNVVPVSKHKAQHITNA